MFGPRPTATSAAPAGAPDAGGAPLEPRRRRRKRLAIFAATGALVLAGLGFAAMKDIEARQSLSLSSSELAAAKSALSQRTSEIDDLHNTVRVQQQRIDSVNGQNQALAICSSDLKAVINDVVNNDATAANADYSKAYAACNSTGQSLPY